MLPDAPRRRRPAALVAWTRAQIASLPFVDIGCGCDGSALAVLVALSYTRALPGRGALCAYEGYAAGDDWQWRWRVGPPDGAATVCAADALPALSTRARWREVLAAGAAGAATLTSLEPGLWAFAGPREGDLEAEVKACAAGCEQGVLLPLKLLAWRPVVPAADAWTAWASAWAASIQTGDLRAGAVVDLAVLAHLLRLAAARVGATVGDPDDPRAVTLRRDELARAVDLERLALSLTLRGEGLAEGAARAVAQTLALLADASDAVAAARALRPAVRFHVHEWSLLPERPDGTRGPSIALPEVTGAWRRGDAWERAVRFGCDVLPPWSDPSRVCPCGAPACFVTRILAARALADATGAAPVVLARWPEVDPRAVLVAGLGCEQHTWFPGEEALAAQGISRDDVLARVRADAPLASWAFTARVVDDEGARALLAQGHHVASVMRDDHLVSALHRACGAPLRGPAVGALAVGTGALVLHEPGWSPASLDRLCAAVSLAGGAAAQGPDALLVSRDARVDALPRGRMLRQEETA
ncbi:MAG: hypothetical protein U0325_00115 [Polyangiales bacterium]